MSVVQSIREYLNERIVNQDGVMTGIELNKGASPESLEAFEAQKRVKLPETLKELLLFSNGLSFFGLHILSLEEMEYFPVSGIITFHAWGNGDFDGVTLFGEEAAVFFMFHSEDNTYRISDSLLQWFDNAVTEIRQYGTLCHPWDYQTGTATTGLYNISITEPMTDTATKSTGVRIQDIILLYNNPNLAYVENEIAQRAGYSLDRESIPVLMQLSLKELQEAALSTEQVANVIEENSEKIIRFGIEFLGKGSGGILSTGVAITYSIYLAYLKKPRKDFIQYIKTRRIPHAKRVVDEIIDAYKIAEAI
ncbi:MAG: SMI1/KNR4 family protein [Chitinophagaceae bacterium]